MVSWSGLASATAMTDASSTGTTAAGAAASSTGWLAAKATTPIRATWLLFSKE